MANNICISFNEDVETPAWAQNIEPFINKVMELTEQNDWELSVCFCSDDFIKNLNNQYRQIDEPTDVLSFENGTEYQNEDGNTVFCAGDIVISIAALYRNVETFGVTDNDELKRLLVHGYLHLAGYDHGEYHIGKDGRILDAQEKVPVYGKLSDENKEECEMLIFQEEILMKLKDERII